MSESISILAALAAVTETDLEAIDTELAAIEARKTMLQDARRLINAKLHPDRVKRPGGSWKKQRAKTQEQTEAVETEAATTEAKPSAGSTTAPSLASQIRTVLEAGGPMTPAEIARQLTVAGRTASEHGVRIAIARSPHSFEEQPNGRIKLPGR